MLLRGIERGRAANIVRDLFQLALAFLVVVFVRPELAAKKGQSEPLLIPHSKRPYVLGYR